MQLIDVGKAHSCITSSSALFCWGANGALQIDPAGQNPVPVATVQQPNSVVFAAGGDQLCWVANGRGFCRGNTGTTAGLVSGQLDMRLIAPGRDHACALGPTTETYCRNDFGQTGNGAPAPTQGSSIVTVATPAPLVAIAAGGFFTCGIANTGQAYCWGDGAHGKLGNGSTTLRATPALVSGVTFAH
jgi:alpha-tubulin suppressor-like RCC1 family protein